MIGVQRLRCAAGFYHSRRDIVGVEDHETGVPVGDVRATPDATAMVDDRDVVDEYAGPAGLRVRVPADLGDRREVADVQHAHVVRRVRRQVMYRPSPPMLWRNCCALCTRWLR